MGLNSLHHPGHEIVLGLQRVERPLRPELAGVEAEAGDREPLAAEQVAAEQVGGQALLRRRPAEAAQGHVGRELAPLGLEADLAQRPLDAAAQRGESTGRVVDADPERVRRPAGRELAQALERQLERRVADVRQGLADLVEACPGSTSPMKRKVRWNWPGSLQRMPGRPSHRRSSASLTSSGGSRATNRRGMAPLPGQAGRHRRRTRGLAKERRSPYLVALGRGGDAVASRA